MPTLWSLVDSNPDGLTATAFEDWLPSIVADALLPLWLRKTAAAEIVVCPECGDHDEELAAVTYPSGKCRYFIPCAAHGRVEILPEELRQWRFDLDAVAASVATSLSLTGAVSTEIPTHLWRLGRTTWQQKSRDVYFVRGLSQLDESPLQAIVRNGLRPILLTCGPVPDEQLWASRPPAVVPLSQVSQWCDSQLILDHLQLMERVAEQDQRISEPVAVDPPPVSAQAIRRQVKAEIASMLTDDVLIATYREHGSVRLAAKALSRQIGQNVSKDKVQRAIQRAGGLSSVAVEHNSLSVRRTVASQRCDNKKKIANRSEAMDWQ